MLAEAAVPVNPAHQAGPASLGANHCPGLIYDSDDSGFNDSSAPENPAWHGS
jgi:hypothetical protein